MFPIFPLQMAEVMLRGAQLMAESQVVMTLRVMGMMGAWPIRPDEMTRMVSEKGPAFVRAATKAHRAAIGGAQPHSVMLAAMKPLTRKARGNRKRLTRSG